ncbi:MAG: LPS assembly protein LptD [Gammaproteobacteria bacterium]|nr:LPS assembly protein LptD [Gammaproteobacteria bacterium]NIW48687.1 LPS assembly protein LptD [Gammaproteobacteria bacterium]
MNWSLYKYLLVLMLLSGVSLTVMPAENKSGLCPASLPIPERPKVDRELAVDEMYIIADEAELEEYGLSVLDGDVEITRNLQQLQADHITYDHPSDLATMMGAVEYWDDAMYLHSEAGEIDFRQETSQFEDAFYFILEKRGRGEAKSIFHDDSRQFTKLRQVTYTTCEPEDNFWRLSSSKIRLDHNEEWGTAKNAVLRIKNIPLFYTPHISFPISDKRKSGFLTPSFGSTNRSGYEVQTPYYWNIAPEMDATITPRVLTDSGLMMMGEYRYLLKRGNGELNLEYLPNDSEFNDEDRNLFNFTHNQSFADKGRLYLTYNRVSDSEYFKDFGSTINTSSIQYLERRAEAAYSGSWWNLTARAQGFQTVDSTIPLTSRPYQRLPQVLFNAASPFKNRRLNLALNSQVAYFDRDDDGFPIEDVNGGRLHLYPSVSFPMYTPASFFIPKIGVRYTQYDLHDTGTQFSSSPSLALPITSVDTGLFFERDTRLLGDAFIHTLEPRLYYLYIPDEDQSDLPDFDTGIYSFSFDSLFREDRFSSVDRVGDANQFTLALTSRLIQDNSGRELGYASLGQIYYVDKQDVVLPGTLPNDNSSSPLVAEVGTSILDELRLRGTIQWDPNEGKTEKVLAAAQYNPADNKVINFAYRVRRPQENPTIDIEQTELSFHWPITKKWNALARWVYALPDRKNIDIFAGIEYESCCWAFRTVARRFLTGVNDEYNTGIFFQLELKGLAGLGTGTETFLTENIPGFKSEF